MDTIRRYMFLVLSLDLNKLHSLDVITDDLGIQLILSFRNKIGLHNLYHVFAPFAFVLGLTVFSFIWNYLVREYT